MRILDKAARSPERILIYGAPKSAKTRFATALPWGTEPWGDKAVYVAADAGGASLRSVLLEDRKHLVVVDPHPESGPYDPLHEAVAIATHDWTKLGASTIIWDTITQTAEDVLRAYSIIGNYASNPITFGKKGTAEFHVHPNEGDYGAAQNSIGTHLMGHLFAQPLNLIIIAHETWVEPKNANACIGGPATIGRALVGKLPGEFDTVIRTEVRRVSNPGKATVTEFRARTQPHGPWIVGIRNPGVNLPDYVMGEDPRGFWLDYTKLVS